MDIISRPDALRSGLSKYYTGKPCKHGHDCERFTSNRACLACNNKNFMEWDGRKAYAQRWRTTNKDHVRTEARKWRQANPNKVHTYNLDERSRLRSTLNQMRRRAHKKGIDFSLTLEDLVIPEVCPVLHLPLLRTLDGRSDNSPSFDRVDNAKGYTKDNVQVISWRANRLKSDATVEDLYALIAYMQSHKKNNNEKESITSGEEHSRP